ncbi:MAG: hypothetical protein JNM59_05885 [Hyphomonadaceae bacterium]|nr:hypothetical protein [Hyphomonadaceae bacterium]
MTEFPKWIIQAFGALGWIWALVQFFGSQRFSTFRSNLVINARELPRGFLSIFRKSHGFDYLQGVSEALRIRTGLLFVDKPLSLHQITSTFEEVWTDRPPSIDRLAPEALLVAAKEAKEAGRTLDNNPSYELRRIDVARVTETGNRERRYDLIIRPTDFHSFVYPNLAVLQESKRSPQASADLRSAADLDDRRLHFDDMEHLKARFRIGTNTVAVTFDQRVILSIRSKKQLMATGEQLLDQRQPAFRLHTSAPEGMLRTIPAGLMDDDVLNGNPHPGKTSLRALRTELGLLQEEHFEGDRLRCLGWYLDLLRSEPQFVFFVRLKATAKEVCKIWNMGTEDAHENLSICCVPWDADTIAKVYAQKLFAELDAITPDKDRGIFERARNARAEWSSNQAKASMLIASAHAFGARNVAESISPLIRDTDQAPTN